MTIGLVTVSVLAVNAARRSDHGRTSQARTAESDEPRIAPSAPDDASSLEPAAQEPGAPKHFTAESPDGLTLSVRATPAAPSVGETITFEVEATDRRGAFILIGMDYGDGEAHDTGDVLDACWPRDGAAPARPTEPRAHSMTYTHTYTAPGTYTVTFTAETVSCHDPADVVRATETIEVS